MGLTARCDGLWIACLWIVLMFRENGGRKMGVTIRQIVDALTLPGGNPPETVDGLVTGAASASVTGIVTAFMPTVSVIEQAVKLDSNLIVAHEGLFYTHRHGDEWLANDPIVREKKRRLSDAGIAVYRCHDYLHRVIPDQVTESLVQALGWGDYVQERQQIATIIEMPETTVREVAAFVKRRMDIPYLRVIGDPAAACRRVGVIVGYRGSGQTVIPLFEQARLDLVLYGEGPEWEAPEYVRDAIQLGEGIALLVLGHAESEEPGMAALAQHLGAKFPGVPVHYVKEKPLFTVM